MTKSLLLYISLISVSIQGMDLLSDEEAREAKDEKTRTEYEGRLLEHLENEDIFLALSVVEDKLPRLPGYIMSDTMKQKVIADLQGKLTEQQYSPKEKVYMLELIKKVDAKYKMNADLRNTVIADARTFIRDNGTDEEQIDACQSIMAFVKEPGEWENAESSFQIRKYLPRITLVSAFLIATVAGFAVFDRARKTEKISQYKVN